MTQTQTHTSASKPPADRPLFEIIDLAVSFDVAEGSPVPAVDGLSLTIRPRQTLALVGESGCGKSVTALTVLQLLPQPPGIIQRGSILLDGKNILNFTEKQMLKVRGREIAMIFQEPTTSLNPVYSVGDQIIEAIMLHQHVTQQEARDIAVQALSDVGIDQPRQSLKAYPHQFSGGMQQRVMTAIAMACRPRLLLADEPTTSLDVTIQAQTLELLHDMQRKTNMGMMLISHDLGVVAQNADIVCVMYLGRVIEYATVFELFDNPLHPYTRGLFNSIPRLGSRKYRLTTVSELINDPREFRQLPGFKLGVVPWWPTLPPPPGIELAPGSRTSLLHEVVPNHWVACWRSEYLAHHPTRRPDIDFRKETASE